jgi:pyridoxal phosphate enzyme (YggS family)
MIRENVARIKEKISFACARVKRDPSGVSLVVVSKGRSIEEMAQAVACGLNIIGENRVQEALLKYPRFKEAQWHMIGHLQTNKVKEAVRIFDLIHSLDSLHLAQAIDKEAKRIGKIQDVLLEVKISSEETKYGVNPDEAADLLKGLAKLSGIKVRGFMGIAALVEKAEDARSYFRTLRQLRDNIDKNMLLSMGMSDDFEVAIEEGADIIRVGRAIFE